MKSRILFSCVLLVFVFSAVSAQTVSTEKKGKAPVNIEKAQKNEAKGSSPVLNVQKKNTKAVLASKKGIKAYKGTVIDFQDWLRGSQGFVKKEKAIELVKNCHTLALISGKGKSAKIYFIANTAGTLASSRLAELADGQVTVTGKLVKQGGFNLVIADTIEK